MSLLKIKQLILIFMLSFCVISTPANAGVIDSIFRIFSKAAAPAEGAIVKEEGKILANSNKIIDDSTGIFDDFTKWFKRLFGIPVDTKLENELARRFGDYAKKKVRNETKECAMQIYKANQNNPNKSKNNKTEENARNSCAGGVLNCLNVNYRNVKNPTNQMFDRCIKEINTNIYRYIKN
jgi:hypothetical protein